jgi:hypothetical protein
MRTPSERKEQSTNRSETLLDAPSLTELKILERENECDFAGFCANEGLDIVKRVFNSRNAVYPPTLLKCIISTIFPISNYSSCSTSTTQYIPLDANAQQCPSRTPSPQIQSHNPELGPNSSTEISLGSKCCSRAGTLSLPLKPPQLQEHRHLVKILRLWIPCCSHIKHQIRFWCF